MCSYDFLFPRYGHVLLGDRELDAMLVSVSPRSSQLEAKTLRTALHQCSNSLVGRRKRRRGLLWRQNLTPKICIVCGTMKSSTNARTHVFLLSIKTLQTQITLPFATSLKLVPVHRKSRKHNLMDINETFSFVGCGKICHERCATIASQECFQSKSTNLRCNTLYVHYTYRLVTCQVAVLYYLLKQQSIH